MPNQIFANARAAALFSSLLGADRLGRMIDCASADEALKILAEVNFGDGIPVSSAADFEILVEAEEKKYTAFVRETCPSERLMRFLLAGYDYHNAEAISRAKYLKSDFTPMLGAEGEYSVSLLEEKIFADDYTRFSPELSAALSGADELFVSGKADGKSISSLFRRALYIEMKTCAEREKPLKKLFSEKADAANIAVALRSRNFALASEMTVDGGTLSEEEIRFLCEEAAESIREKFRYSPQKDLIFSALDDFSEGKPLTDFEKKSDGFALVILKKERYNDEGYKPFLRYCYYKLAELANVKIIMSCLVNGVEKNIIRARLRETYEGQNGYYR